jgi:transcription elongation factor Elf1
MEHRLLVEMEADLEREEVPYTVYCPHCGIDVELRIMDTGESYTTIHCRICEKTIRFMVRERKDG